MADVDKLVTMALQQGHSMEDVLNEFSASEDPAEKAWAENWRKNSQGSSDRMNKFVASNEAEQANEMSNFAQQLSGGLALPSWMKTPEGLLTGGLAAKGGFEVGKAVGKATMPLISRMISKEPTSNLPKTFTPPNKIGPITDVVATPTEYEKALGPNWQEMLDRSEAARKEKQAIAQQNARQSMTKPGTIPTQNAPMGMAPPAPPAPPAPVAAAPAPAAPAPVAPAPVGTPEIPTVAQLGQQALGQAPVAPPQTVEQVAEEAVAPTEGKKKPGRKPGSKNLTEEQKLAKKGGLPGMTPYEVGMRGHLLGMYGGKQNPAAQQAYEQVKEILGYTPAYENNKGGSLKPEETEKIKQWQKENMPGPKITATKEMKKVLKAGTPAAIAAMVLTPEFANASTTQKRQILGEALLPLGISPSELQPGTLGEAQLRAFQEAQKLGSPYRSVPPPR